MVANASMVRRVGFAVVAWWESATSASSAKVITIWNVVLGGIDATLSG